MSTQSSSKPTPVALPTTLPFWEGTQRGDLRFQRCSSCGHAFLYPRTRCPNCGSATLAWESSSGRAILDSYIISHVPAPGWTSEPYVVAIVKLEEGPRMLTNIVGVAADPELLPLDMLLEVTFEKRGAFELPVFRPRKV